MQVCCIASNIIGPAAGPLPQQASQHLPASGHAATQLRNVALKCAGMHWHRGISDGSGPAVVLAVWPGVESGFCYTARRRTEPSGCTASCSSSPSRHVKVVLCFLSALSGVIHRAEAVSIPYQLYGLANRDPFETFRYGRVRSKATAPEEHCSALYIAAGRCSAAVRVGDHIAGAPSGRGWLLRRPAGTS